MPLISNQEIVRTFWPTTSSGISRYRLSDIDTGDTGAGAGASATGVAAAALGPTAIVASAKRVLMKWLIQAGLVMCQLRYQA